MEQDTNQQSTALPVARFIFRETLGLAVTAAAMFWSAGRIDWWPGWAVLAVLLGWVAATGIIGARVNPGLLAERLGPRRGAKTWDVAIMSAVGLLQLGRFIVAGLDQRFTWTGEFPPAVQIGALLACALGYALITWATAANAFFSQIVRIQRDRGQRVAAGGPYRFLRHPGYLGAILFELAAPLLLASLPALLIGAAAGGLFVLRTALEDRTLHAELDGYQDYAKCVPYRLLPGIW